MVKFSSKHAARSLRCPPLDSWRRHQPPAEDRLAYLGDQMVMAVCVCTSFAYPSNLTPSVSRFPTASTP